MNRLHLLCIAAATLAGASACSRPLPPPATVGQRTTFDERGALSVELAYQAAAQAVLFASRTGRVSSASRARLAALDRRAYETVLSARAAYDAGNANSYEAAVAIARERVRVWLAEAIK